MNVPFFKYHALGNDYLVIDPKQAPISLTPENIRLLCHRNYGIGSDGILYGPAFIEGMPMVRIYNPDGSEAEKSGNGVRIFARYLLDAGYVGPEPFRLKTIGGDVAVDFLDARGRQIKVDMGTVTFQSNRIPVNGDPREVVNEEIRINDQTYRMTCVSIGNPHCVVPMVDVSREVAEKLGPILERHPLFPNRINVQFLKVLGPEAIRIEIWERGAGYTLASGSSSCAAACAAYKLGLVKNRVEVNIAGGVIQIEIKADGHVFMTGSVTGVSKGELLPDLAQEATGY